MAPVLRRRSRRS